MIMYCSKRIPHTGSTLSSQPQRLRSSLSASLVQSDNRLHCSPLVQIVKRRRCPRLIDCVTYCGTWHFRARLVAWRCWRYSFCTARHPTSATFVGGAFDQKIRTRELRTILPRGHGGGNRLFALDRAPFARAVYGSTRFNDLRRGVPRMSPALLSKRLKELEQAGVIAVTPAAQPGAVEYKLTQAGEDLRGVIMSLGVWGQRWVESSLSLKNLDPAFLMWDMRRNLKPLALPDRRCTVEFIYPEVGSGRRYWWLVIEDGTVDLCGVDPGYDVDLHVRSSLRSMTAVWMGHSTLQREIDAGAIQLIGDKALARRMHEWLGLSSFAKEKPALLTPTTGLVSTYPKA